MKPDNVSAGKPRALILTPESPYPMAGGGALRCASLVEYFRQRYELELVIFGVDIELPYHSRRWAARVARNAIRFARNVPPLVDRFAGFEQQIAGRISGGTFDLCVVEHFWCASYAALLRPVCRRLVLDMHNIESELARARSRVCSWPESAAHARFARAYRTLESKWLDCFDVVLVPSELDRQRLSSERAVVYPNALPDSAVPKMIERETIAFSGNMEYDPNIDAVRWFRGAIWPLLRDRFPQLEWRLIGKNPHAVEPATAGDARIVLTGPVEEAIVELASAKVCVVPLRAASGTRFKILEAWAAQRAVVSTSIGAEGLDARHGEHLLIADDPASFAAAVGRVLNDPELRSSLGSRGRALFEERYSWPVAWRSLAAAGL